MGAVAAMPQIVELNIGHFLIGASVFSGMPEAIAEMRRRIQLGAQQWTGFMILGIGNDLIDIRRIEKTLERYGDRFVQRISPLMSRPARPARLRAASYAKRFAARKRAPKRLAQACDRGFGVIWASAICRPESRPCV